MRFKRRNATHRDRVDVRFDDRSRFNRHRERPEKNRREYRVEYAGGEISTIVPNHIVVIYVYATRARLISTIREERKHRGVFF